MSDQEEEDDEFVTQVGPLNIDWPRSLGYFAGVGAAVALDLIAPPLALFIVAVPFLKLLKRPDAPLLQRLIAATLEGMAKPVGGDSDGTVTLAEVDAQKKAEKQADEKQSGEKSRPEPPSAAPTAPRIAALDPVRPS